VQSEIIVGLSVVLQGIAETSSDEEIRTVAEAALDSILMCFTQYQAMLEGAHQTHH
jgi:hypothetical protein